jgi:hypothetical protein
MVPRSDQRPVAGALWHLGRRNTDVVLIEQTTGQNKAADGAAFDLLDRSLD